MNQLNLLKFFESLGLNEVEAKICVAILDEGKATMLRIARKTGINRTKIYRVCQELALQGVIEIIVDKNRQLVQIANIDKLRAKVEERKKEAEDLINVFPDLESYFATSDSIEQTGTKVLFYRGKESIKQLFWNTLRAESELVGFTFRASSEIVGEEFAFKWHGEFIDKGLKMRDIYSDSYKESGQDEALTSLLQLKFKDYSLHFQSKYISNERLNINTQMDIYNDTVAYYRWFNDEVYGVEIQNKELANMQKQIFNIVWDSIPGPQRQIIKSFN